MEGGCNVIPVMDNFVWPPVEQLPEDMRPVCYFNGIRYVLLRPYIFQLIEHVLNTVIKTCVEMILTEKIFKRKNFVKKSICSHIVSKFSDF